MIWKRIVFIAESVMAVSWLLFSISFARTDNWSSVGRFSKLFLLISPVFVYFLIAVPLQEFYYSPDFEAEKILFLEDKGFIFNILLLFYSVVSIINLEVTLRSTSEVSMWQIKYALMGTGSIISINIFYYSSALLYRSLNMNLLPVREGIILVAVLLMGYAISKRKAMDVEVIVSRKMLYRSLSVFVIGFYLLGLGIVGEGMRYFGPQTGKNLTTFAGFLGAIAVFIILLSGQVRRKAIVFINKNFFNHKYDYREQWLKFTQRISLKHSFEELVESIAEGFKEAIDSRGVLIWLKVKGERKYYCVPTSDAIKMEYELSMELIDILKNRNWIFNIHDNISGSIVAENAEFFKKTRAFLIVPLLQGYKLIGFVILRDSLSDNECNYEDYDLLKTLAKQATLAIMNAQLSEELTKAKELEAVGRLSSFILHDLKNAAYMLTLTAQNAEEHIDNPEFQKDAIRTVSNTAEKIKNIIGKLKNLPAKAELELEYSDLGTCVQTALDQFTMNGGPALTFDKPQPVYTKIDREEIIKVIVNLVMNALDASGMQGEVKINMGIENAMAFIKISDNGCGMSSDFVEKKLFKPFQTTKKKGLGIGLYQCKAIIEAHRGKIMVESNEGKGTDFIITLPIVS